MDLFDKRWVTVERPQGPASARLLYEKELAEETRELDIQGVEYATVRMGSPVRMVESGNTLLLGYGVVLLVPGEDSRGNFCGESDSGPLPKEGNKVNKTLVPVSV